MSSSAVRSYAALACSICCYIISYCSGGSFLNSSWVRPPGSFGTYGTFILRGAIPSGMPGAGIICGWAPFCKPPYAIIISCSISIRSSYYFCNSNYLYTSGGIGSMPSCCFLVSFTGSGGGWFILGGVARIGPSSWRSSKSFGMSSYLYPAALIIASASSGDWAPNAFINCNSYGISDMAYSIISRCWFSWS